MNGTSNVTKDQVFNHVAFFEKDYAYDDNYRSYDTAASCITYKANGRVPPGNKYSVR